MISSSSHLILGISHYANEAEIKAAYRVLSMKHHPDREGGDEEHFKKIKAAYEWMIANPYQEPVKSSLDTDDKPVKSSAFNNPFKNKWEEREDTEAEINFTPISKFNASANVLGYAGYLANGDVCFGITLEQAYRGDKISVSIPRYLPQEITLPERMSLDYFVTVDFVGTSAWSKGLKTKIKIYFKIVAHPVYSFEYDNLVTILKFKLVDILEFSNIKLPSPNGKGVISVSLPSNFVLGNDLVISNGGLLTSRTSVGVFGNIVVRIQVELPSLNNNEILQIKNILRDY